MKPRRLAVYGLTAGLLSGGAAGFIMTGSTLASAETAGVTGTVTDPAASYSTSTIASDSSGSTTAPAAGAVAARAARAGWAKSALDGLVADGTLTQEQADKVLATLQAARPAHGPGPKGPRGARLEAAAEALGITAADLRTALAGGKSLADVAREKGVDPATVVEALVAEMKAHLDQHVAGGRHTQAEADQILADARTRIEAFVNGTAPAGGPGIGFGKGGRHRHGPMGGVPAPSDGSGTTTTTS